MRGTLRMLVLASLTTLAVGCGGAPRPKYPHEVASVALDQHRAGRSRIQSMRAEARVDQRGRDGRIRGTVLMFIGEPDLVRFDAMTQFGPAAVLTSDGSTFQLLDMREDRFLTGPTCPENIARLLGISLPAESVVRFLEGDSPVVDAEGAEIETIRGGYRVTLSAEDGSRQTLVFHIPDAHAELPPEQQELRLVRSELRDPSGSVAFRAEYDDHRSVDLPSGERIAMPFVLRFEDPANGRDVLVRFKRIDPNVEPPPGAFEQAPPGGVSVEVVECD
jgi:outer membrane lipoprotein-sorting protein